VESSKKFQDWFGELKEYKEKFGDCNVSQFQEGYESLGSWVQNMRQAKKGRRTMNLTDDMIDSLNDIGFEWNIQKSFNERMKDLKEYKEKFGDCNVRSRNTDYQSLADWVVNMRKARNGKVNSKLTDDMIDSLNDIGFCWGKGQSAELSDAEKVKFGMKAVPKKDDASTVRKRAKADASKDEEDDLPLFSMCVIIWSSFRSLPN